MILLIPNCDMIGTDLCKHYQKKKVCHYYTTHAVFCPISSSCTKGEDKE